MNSSVSNRVLSDTFWSAEGDAVWIKRALLVIAGVAVLAICAKIKFPI
jgi:biotin transport system substrate-specific component